MKKYIKKVLVYIAFDIICDIFYSLSLAGIPYIHKMLFDRIGGVNSYNISSLIMVYILCVLITLLSAAIEMLFGWKSGVEFEKSIKKDFFNSVINFKYKKFKESNIGEYISIQSNDIQQIEMDYLTPLVSIIKSINMIIIYAITIFAVLDVKIAIVLTITSIIALIVPHFTSKVLTKKRADFLQQLGKYTDKITDLFEGFKLVNMFTIHGIMKKHEEILEKTKVKRFTYGKYKVLTLTINHLFIQVINVSTFVTLCVLLSKNKITLGTAIATYGYAQCFIDPVYEISDSFSMIKSLATVKEKLFKILSPDKCDLKYTDDTKYIDNYKEDLVVDNVSVKYDNFKLNNVSYKFVVTG